MIKESIQLGKTLTSGVTSLTSLGLTATNCAVSSTFNLLNELINGFKEETIENNLFEKQIIRLSVSNNNVEELGKILQNIKNNNLELRFIVLLDITNSDTKWIKETIRNNLPNLEIYYKD